MNIRYANIDDLDAISGIERRCFPPAEAASYENTRQRLADYKESCWVLEDKGQILSFVSAMPTNQYDLTDDMYENGNLYSEDGDWLMIFGLDTDLPYQRQGYAELIMARVAEDSSAKGRKGIVLCCKEKLIHYYEKLGYSLEGISDSVHGGVAWYSMRMVF